MNTYKTQQESNTAKWVKQRGKEDNIAPLTNYLNIWKNNPSYKDINSALVSIKTIFMIALLMFFSFSSYFLFLNLNISMGISLIVLFGFIIAFHDEFFFLKNLVSFNFRRFTVFNPFKELRFWRLKEDPFSIFLTNSKDLVSTGLRIFEIEVIAENVHPVLSQFVKALNTAQIPYSYQIVQNPSIDMSIDDIGNLTRYQKLNSLKSFKTSIYFSVFYSVKGVLNRFKLKQIEDRLKYYSNALKNNFHANFNHYKINLLAENNLINAMRTLIFNNNSIPFKSGHEPERKKKLNAEAILKNAFCFFLLAYSSFILIQLGVSFILIISFNISLIAIMISLFWRELLFQFKRTMTMSKDDMEEVDPFQKMEFFRFRRIPESIFMHLDKKLLINLKVFNLKHILPPAFDVQGHFLSKPDKFFRSLITLTTQFTYSAFMSPITFDTFQRDGSKHLKSKVKNSVEHIGSSLGKKNWLEMRAGIWRTIINITTSSYKLINSVKMSDIMDLEDELVEKASTIKNAFEMNFPNYVIDVLRSNNLISGFLMITSKNKFFRLNGSHLNYVLLQGKVLALLTNVSNDLKKGIQTKIAAEFNTPLQLKNFINIGYAINTEILEQETPAGFTEDQLQALLIVNGTSTSREALKMKIVSELVKTGKPSIIFDYSGKWSKLIRYFNGSKYENDFLYFKLGKAFNIDPIRSDIPYDKNNMKYLEYMFDAYALAFKKDERTIEMLRNTIMRNPEMDLSTLNLELVNQQNWEKSPITDTLISLFNDFTRQDLTFFHSPTGDQEDRITAKDFVIDNKTIIIDLSISTDFKKHAFITFTIISKIIHYINNSNDFHEKIIVIPNVDLFFDAWFLDKNHKYGIINKFINPLKERGFGLLMSANQIHYLHSNFFNFFKNIVAFRATDNRDTTRLKDLMNFQTYHGVGIYSSKRNETFQVDYLMNMKEEEAIVKRSDINQPFPIIFNFKEIFSIQPLNYDQIIRHMKNQGYDLLFTEKKILAQAKKTIFQKDFDKYSGFIEEIINFLKALKSVDKIGNLYENKIKEELKKYIYPKASKITKKKDSIKKMRDDLFQILTKQGYLVENHSKKASGSESIRTSYSVGPQYQKALDDYFQTKKNSITSVSIESIENKANLEDIETIFREESDATNIKENLFSKVLEREFSIAFSDLLGIYRCTKRENYSEALHISKRLVKKFFISLYKGIKNVNFVVTSEDLSDFIEKLVILKEFPFTTEEIEDALGLGENLNEIEGNIEVKAKEMYDFLSVFFNRIHNYIIET